MNNREHATTIDQTRFGGTQRDLLVVRLNRNLATLTDLALAYKQAHWNVLGPDFWQLHDMFEQFATEVRGHQDLVAERATTLGGTACGTLQAAAEHTVLPPFPPDASDQSRLIEELVNRVDQVVEELRTAAATSEHDLATQDLYIEVLRGIEKQRWMLLAHLGGREKDARRNGSSG